MGCFLFPSSLPAHAPMQFGKDERTVRNVIGHNCMDDLDLTSDQVRSRGLSVLPRFIIAIA